ncbi:hypothetical protein V6N13_016616 [Hibiscus sabdariffa]
MPRLNPKDSNDNTWQIKTFVGEHKCNRDTKNRNCTSKWQAREYIEKFIVEPNYSAKSLKQDVLKDHILQVPRSKCIRAKKMALEMIHGNQEKQYARIYDYLAELRGTNSGTTTICHLDNRLFVRMYVCLQACKDGFKAGCRPLICLDGCFLKGHYQGWLLAAVGIDANDCIYPLAYAVVECENRESWSWFLQLLETDLELTNSFHYTFMSYKQNGLVESILDIFPNGEHRTCVRHLYSNFKSKPENQGRALKDCLWKAARATYMKEWTDAMNEMKVMSEPSFNWLQPKDPRQWLKSHFSSRCKSDILLNNLSESFNKMILESRDKPILTMMEMIRSKLVTRIAAKKEAAEKIIGILCPKIQKKNCWPRHASGHKWEVSAGYEDQHAVDLEIYSCSCRKWDLTGIPCIHVVSVIMKIGVTAHYMTDEPILPPVIRRPVGRPQKNRRKEPDEPVTKTGRIRKIGAQMTCSKCGNRGHNKRSCRGKVGGNTSSNNNTRVAPRRTIRVAQKMTANRSNTSAHDATTAHARTSSTKNITEPNKVSKLPVRRPTMSNPATSSSYPRQGSRQSQGSIMVVRWMPSQQSTAKEP